MIDEKLTMYSMSDFENMEFPELPDLPVDLDLLERLDGESTPEPWGVAMDLGADFGPKDGIQYGGGSDYGGFGFDGFCCSSNEEADVRLIAEMRNALPGLLKMARELEKLKAEKP